MAITTETELRSLGADFVEAAERAMSSGRPARKPPTFTASSIVGNLTVPARRGSRIAEICSSEQRENPQDAQWRA